MGDDIEMNVMSWVQEVQQGLCNHSACSNEGLFNQQICAMRCAPRGPVVFAVRVRITMRLDMRGMMSMVFPYGSVKGARLEKA